MATAAPVRRPLLERLLPDRLLGWLALAMLGFVLAALARGEARWQQVPAAVWVHLGFVILVLTLTPMMLWRAKGTRSHRTLGWLWAGAMLGAALASFWIRDIRDGGFSWIHLLSAYVVIAVPWLVMEARRHRVDAHRAHGRNLVIFALLVAGFFTFPFNRMLGSMLFG